MNVRKRVRHVIVKPVLPYSGGSLNVRYKTRENLGHGDVVDAKTLGIGNLIAIARKG